MHTYEIDPTLVADGVRAIVRQRVGQGPTPTPALAGRAPEAPSGSGLLALQRAAGNATVSRLLEDEPASPILDVAGRGGGRPLEPAVADFMASRLGQDFGDVRVHTDYAASESARAINAQAYTVGTDVVFQIGRYQPDTPAGQRMLAHELTHVVQQRSGPVDGTPTGGGIRISDPCDRFEQAAERTAEQVVASPTPAAAQAQGSVSAQREEDEGADRPPQTGNDVVFRSGTDRPEIPAGRRILAHELTHVVQHRCGPVAGAPAARGIRISDPSDPLEQVAERAAAGVMAGESAQTMRAGVSPAPTQGTADDAAQRDVQTMPVQRESSTAAPKDASPFAAPAGAKPADPASLMKPVLQGLINALINHAYTDYLNAVETVRTNTEKDAEKAQARDPVNMLLPVVAGLCLPAAIEGMAAGIAASATGTTRNVLVTAVMKGGLDAEAAGKAFDVVAANATPENVKKALDFMVDKTKEGLKENLKGDSIWALTSAYLDGLEKAADLDSSVLLQSVVGIDDVSMLLGLHAAFSHVSREAFLTQLTGKATHFRTELAPALLPEKGGGRIVEINAYGQPRLARVRYNTDDGHIHFMAWITPDMEDMARASVKGGVQTVDPSTIEGGIPDPTRGQAGEKRVVRIDARGKVRLAEVALDHSFWTGKDSTQFIRWIPEDEAENAGIRASQQIGGANQIPADQVEGLRAPD